MNLKEIQKIHYNKVAENYSKKIDKKKCYCLVPLIFLSFKKYNSFLNKFFEKD